METKPLFTIHGSRGTAPVSDRAFARHGGKTTCFSVETERGVIIVDAGTGIISIGDRLAKLPLLPPITILFTHFHLDHVLGLPLFKPLYPPKASVTIMGNRSRKENWRRSLRYLVAPPFWPVALTKMKSAVKFKFLPPEKLGMKLYGVKITWRELRHPQQSIAYRFTCGNRSVVFATDNEPEEDNETARNSMEDFCRGSDVLIADAQFTPGEYSRRRGWGHGTWETCAHLAEASGVKKLILTHHDRSRTDFQIDKIVRRSRRIFSATFAARDGMQV